MAGRRNQRGFTLAETAVSLALVSILVLAMSNFLADNQRAFNKAYTGTFSSTADGATTARAIFQKTIRQASSAAGAASVAADGSWLQVRYSSALDVSAPDRLARFESSGQELHLLRSVLDTGETLSLETVCENVQSVKFHLTGASAQMFLTLQDGGSSRVVNTCATRRSP